MTGPGMSRGRGALVALIALTGLVVAAGGVLAWSLWGPNNFDGAEQRTITIWRGQTFDAIVDSLHAQGIIRDDRMFRITARIMGGTDRIQVGRFLFHRGVSNAEVFGTLRDGISNMLITVTIPEGLTAAGQARIFRRLIGIDSAHYVRLARDGSYARRLGIDAPSLEGFLLPDTYTFYWQQDETEIVRTLVSAFQRFYDDSLQRRTKELGWTTRKVLTLASIVEGEAVIDEERPIIAGVYWNRLRIGMRLEADPTIQYVIPDGPRRLRYSDLKIESPYNTYVYSGLPPGPVNNPGRASILAALWPTRHAYLFFVANGRGGHWFSGTYSQHMKYVRQYRKDRAKAETAG